MELTEKQAAYVKTTEERRRALRDTMTKAASALMREQQTFLGHIQKDPDMHASTYGSGEAGVAVAKEELASSEVLDAMFGSGLIQMARDQMEKEIAARPGMPPGI